MPYSTIGDIDADVRAVLPEHAQRIYMLAYNSAAKRKLSEERCHAIAWAAVKNAGYKKGDDGNWHKESIQESLDATEIIDNGSFTTFKNVVLNVEGVFNRMLKTGHCIETATWTPVIPIYMDHEEQSGFSFLFDEPSGPRMSVGWANEMRVVNEGKKKIRCSFNVYSEYPELIELITNEKLYRQHSIEANAIEHEHKEGVFDGELYTEICHSIYYHGVALMELQKPACSLDQGCGNYSKKEGVIMAESETEPKKDNLELQSKPVVEEVTPPVVTVTSTADVNVTATAPIVESKPTITVEEHDKVKTDLAEYVKKYNDLQEKYQESQALVEKYRPCWDKSQELLKAKKESQNKFISEHTKEYTPDMLESMTPDIREATYNLTVKAVDEAKKHTDEAEAAKVYESIGQTIKQKRTLTIKEQVERQRRIDTDPDFKAGKKNAEDVE